VDEFDAEPFDPHPIRFRPRTHQVVDARYPEAFYPFEQTLS
jgi:hypothetical protein